MNYSEKKITDLNHLITIESLYTIEKMDFDLDFEYIQEYDVVQGEIGDDQSFALFDEI